MQLAGIAHVQLTVSDLARSRPFYRALCQHFEMHCQYDLEGNATESGILYFIGGKTGLAIRAAKPQHADARYHQYKPDLHHLCFRARSREDIDRFHAFFVAELAPLGGKLVAPPRGRALGVGLLLDPVRGSGRHSPRDQLRSRQGQPGGRRDAAAHGASRRRARSGVITATPQARPHTRERSRCRLWVIRYRNCHLRLARLMHADA